MSIVVIIGIVIIGGGFFFLITSIPKRPKKAKAASSSSDKGGASSAKEEFDDEPDELEDGVPNTGKITQVGDKMWVLNPRTAFPLTIYGASESETEELKALLDNRYKTTATETIRKLLPYITENQIGCKEIDDYVKVFRPIYLSHFETNKAASAEFTGAKATAAENAAISEASDKAIHELEIQLHCDLAVLFKGHPKSKRSKEQLVAKFGVDVMKLYASLRKGINTVESSPEIRKAFEKLESFSLVAHGVDVNPKLILKTLSLRNMRKVVQDLSYPNFENKEEAYKAISVLPDLTERLKSVVNLKTVYEKLPIPLERDETQITDEDQREYLSEFAKLLSVTYFRAGVAIQEQKEFEGKSYSFVKGWEISAKKDACKFCLKQAEKKYEKSDYPRTPIHLGCRCTIMTA
jgi:hypothetical protein